MHVQMNTKFDEKLTSCIYYKVESNQLIRIHPEIITDNQQPQLTKDQLKINYKKTNFRYCNCCFCNYLDREYLHSTEGFFKLFEISLCCLIILIGLGVHGVGGEKGFAIFTANFALFVTLTIVIVKLATLNRYLTPKHWFAIECTIYVAISCGFFTSAALLIFIGADFWSSNNPTNEKLPILLAEISFCSTIVYTADAYLVFRHRKIRTWIPFVSEFKI